MRTLTRTEQSTTEASGDLQVMLVEDDEMITRMIGLMLGGEPDVVMTAGGSDVAALTDEVMWRDVDVAIVDLFLPRATGGELLRWLADNAPHVRRIAMSGAVPDLAADATDAHVRLLKPFTIDDLVAALRP
jgi:CheY-like chemotaxis protein